MFIRQQTETCSVVFKQTMRDFQSELLTELATTDVQELWDMFSSRLEQGIDKIYPHKESWHS